MTKTPAPKKERNLGQVVWTDLTVPDAENLKEFYRAVIGWTLEAVDMGGYNDYSAMATGPRPIADGGGHMVSGICHARGENADMPAQWLNYISIDDIETSLQACNTHGGKQVSAIKTYGGDRYCAIADPAGAVIGLYEIARD